MSGPNLPLVVRVNVGNRHPVQFFPAVAESLCCRLVRIQDARILTDPEDQVAGMVDGKLGETQGRLGPLAIGNVDPGSDDFHRIPGGIVHQFHTIVHPAVGSILVEKTVLAYMGSPLEQAGKFVNDAWPIVGVDVRVPEAGDVDELARFVTQVIDDVIADICGAVIIGYPAGINDRRAKRHEVLEPFPDDAQFALGLFPVCDVFDDGQEEAVGLAGKLKGAGCDVHPDVLTVVAEVSRFHTITGDFCAQEPVCKGKVVRHVVGMAMPRIRGPHEFVLGIPQHFLECRIDIAKRSVLLHDAHADRSFFEHQPEAFFALAQSGFSLSAFKLAAQPSRHQLQKVLVRFGKRGRIGKRA